MSVGLDCIGKKAGDVQCRMELAHRRKTLSLQSRFAPHDVIDDEADMMQSESPAALGVQIVADRRTGIVLLHELDHHIAPLPDHGRMIERARYPLPGSITGPRHANIEVWRISAKVHATGRRGDSR
jgi:hypothetical protein